MRGIYHKVDGSILYHGERKASDPVGLVWQEVTEADQWVLLESIPHPRLIWNSAEVVERSQPEQDEIVRQELIRKDEEYIDQEQLKAFAVVVLREINILREVHGLNPRTPAQLRAAFLAQLGRTHE